MKTHGIGTLSGILTLTLALAIQVRAQTVPTNGLIAYYPLAGNANDASGNGNNGVLLNVSFSQDRFGVPGKAAQFSGARGTNSAIDCPTLGNLPYYPISYSCWFLLASNLVINVDYPSSSGAYMNLVGREQSDNAASAGAFGLISGEILLHLTNDLAYFYPSVICTTSGTVHPTTNVWYHGVLTIDNTGLVSMYVNGGLRGTSSINPTTLAGAGGLPFRIGGSSYDLQVMPGGNALVPRYAWRGLIDDVRIYNRALSTNEVSQLFASESVAPICVPYSATASANVVNGFVVGVSLADRGCGYTNTPLVFILGGGGSGATASATVTNGVVVGVSITNPGSGYTSTPAVYISSPFGPAPHITQQPQTLVVTNGTSAVFGVGVVGVPPLGFQWQKDSVDLVDGGAAYGSASNILTLATTAASDAGNYGVVITNAYGSVTSGLASLTVLGAPVITSQPQSQTVRAGSNVVLTVEAMGVPMTYQWRFNGVAITNGTGAALSLTNAQFEQSGTYSVAITNRWGYSLSSNVTLTVLSPPQLLTQPVSTVGYWGEGTTFSVPCQGTPPLSYQWYFDGVPIVWGTNATLSLTNLDFTDAGTFSVQVTNLYGSVSSGFATLIVNPAGVSLGLYAGLTLTGSVGKTLSIQYATTVGSPTNWTTITNITLTQPVQLWVDTNVNVSLQGKGFYRVIASP